MLKYTSLIGVLLVLVLGFTQISRVESALASVSPSNTPVTSADNASGMPDTPQFGFGGHLYVDGPGAQIAIEAAAKLGLDWLALDFDWAAQWPEPANPADLAKYDQVFSLAQQQHLNILLSITNAPSWGIGPTGPDPVITANLVLMLSRQYRGTLQAIELFPGANTARGWGAPADPSAYTALIKTVQDALRASQEPIILVAGGLAPLAAPAVGDIDDVAFLEGLYASGALPAMPIVSLRLPAISGSVVEEATAQNRQVLRHYEDFRQVMLKYGHDKGLIWLTGISWPSDFSDARQQAQWTTEAYQLLIPQLFIGAVFFDSLNPSPTGLSTALITPDGVYHPAFYDIGQIAQTKNQTAAGFLTKKYTPSDDFKHPQP